MNDFDEFIKDVMRDFKAKESNDIEIRCDEFVWVIQDAYAKGKEDVIREIQAKMLDRQKRGYIISAAQISEIFTEILTSPPPTSTSEGESGQ